MTHLAGMTALARLFGRCPPDMQRQGAPYRNAQTRFRAPRAPRKSTSTGLRRPYTREEMAHIRARYPDVSSGVIARELGRSRAAVKDKITRMGLQPGYRRGRSKLTPDDVRAIRASRDPYKVIAERYGISRKSVSRIARRVSWGKV